MYIHHAGHAIAEYANGAPANSPTVEYVGGLASFSGGATTYFYQDHLSNRFLANSSRTVSRESFAVPVRRVDLGQLRDQVGIYEL